MGLVIVSAALLLMVAAVVLFLSDVQASRARAFDRTYEANRAARTKRQSICQPVTRAKLPERSWTSLSMSTICSPAIRCEYALGMKTTPSMIIFITIIIDSALT
jgi:hypothetical protein